MEAQGQITAALIVSGISFVGIVVNIIYSAVIASRQNNLELKKTRIELLESRRIMLNKVFDKILNMPCEHLIEAHPTEYISRSYNIFSSCLSVSSFFPEDMNETVISMRNEITKAKFQKDSKMKSSAFIQRILHLEGELSRCINDSLRTIEDEIHTLLK